MWAYQGGGPASQAHGDNSTDTETKGKAALLFEVREETESGGSGNGSLVNL